MDAAGAEELRKRIEEQRHWEQAEAVRDGRQSATDPDSFELEELVDGVRYYGRDEQVTVVDGRRSLVTYRLTKALVDGWWQRSNVRESVRYLDEVPTKSS
ncbi:MAG: hypothetical protein E6G32_07325 [Actinobacteria bacterium]|nr:MAG: hypothetical protein E6G32_07325 [Actinomycetota bacterium]